MLLQFDRTIKSLEIIQRGTLIYRGVDSTYVKIL